MKRSTEVEHLARRFYDGLRAADVRGVAATISQRDGLVWIGTDPKEWWTGYETMVEVFSAQLAATGGFEVVGADPQGYAAADGQTAWVADQAALRMPDGEQVPVRLTATAQRDEDGELRFVQFHVSIGVGNEEALGAELPT